MHTSPRIEVHQPSLRCCLLAILLAGCGLAMTVGCAVEEQKPRTVTEFLKLPRVGENQR
jgi:hypothetical protein